jgi:hypothetical protein
MKGYQQKAILAIYKQIDGKKPVFHDIHFLAKGYVFSGTHFSASKILGRKGVHNPATL